LLNVFLTTIDKEYKNMLICLSGQSRVGKDSIADVLVRDFKYVKVAFADGLRELASSVFDMPANQFTDADKKEAPFVYPVRLQEEHIGLLLSHIENNWSIPVSKESKDKMLALVGTEMTTPRKLLQIIGTDLVRDCIDDQFWIKALEHKIGNLADVVITDARFSGERQFAREKGALMCLVKRPSLQSNDSHRAENDLGEDTEYNLIFNNDDTLNRFKIEVNGFFNNYLRRPRY
jgi:hypothetical protein